MNLKDCALRRPDGSKINEPTKPTWITFELMTPNPATKRWAVRPKDGGLRIGIVSWYGPWRKYCFFPTPETVFEWVCLTEIAAFCENQTLMHRAAKKPAAQPPPPDA